MDDESLSDELTVDTAETTDLQRSDGDGRDDRGRFVRGNQHGWKRGQTGNIKGRRDTMTDLLRRKLDEPHDRGRTRAEAVVDALINEATAGNVRAAALIYERLSGRMPTISSATLD